MRSAITQWKVKEMKRKEMALIDRVIEKFNPSGLEVVELVDLDPRNYDSSVACEWHDPAEDQWWRLEARQKNISEFHAIRWTWSAEDGEDDTRLVDRVEDGEEDDLREWLWEVASDPRGPSDGVREAKG